jgi:hypothetical protein
MQFVLDDKFGTAESRNRRVKGSSAGSAWRMGARGVRKSRLWRGSGTIVAENAVIVVNVPK